MEKCLRPETPTLRAVFRMLSPAYLHAAAGILTPQGQPNLNRAHIGYTREFVPRPGSPSKDHCIKIMMSVVPRRPAKKGDKVPDPDFNNLMEFRAKQCLRSGGFEIPELLHFLALEPPDNSHEVSLGSIPN